MKRLIDFWVLDALPVIWLFILVGYAFFSIMWKLGKVKIAYEDTEDTEDSEDSEETSEERSIEDE